MTETNKILQSLARPQNSIFHLFEHDILTHDDIRESTIYECWDGEGRGLPISARTLIPSEGVIAQILGEDCFLGIEHIYA
jgi:hypothetical protein